MATPLFGAQIDIVQLILVDIFRISQNLISQYSTVQDQLLWLVLIPHIVVFLVLFSFGTWISPGHKGLARISSIAAYLVMVAGGWYGTWLVPLVNAFFTVFLISAVLFFIVTRLVPPNVMLGIAKAGTEAVAMGSKKGLARKQVESDIRAIQSALNTLNAKLARPGITPYERAALNSQSFQLDIELAKKKEELRRFH